MEEKQFEYGTIALGIYAASWPLCLVVFLYFGVEALLYYVASLLFSGLLLRPLLEKSGLHRFYRSAVDGVTERKERRQHAEQAANAARKARDEAYRNSRYRDPRLPKNW